MSIPAARRRRMVVVDMTVTMPPARAASHVPESLAAPTLGVVRIIPRDRSDRPRRPFQEAQPVGAPRGLDAGVHAELVEDVGEVGRHGLLADEQPFADLAV